MKYIMLKLKLIFKEKSTIFNLKKIFNVCSINYNEKIGLKTKNQFVEVNYSFNAESDDFMMKEIIRILENNQKFLTAEEIFSRLFINQKELKSSIHTVEKLLKGLEKEKIIYEYCNPELDYSLWGNAINLDRNLIPKENCVLDKRYQKYISAYKHQIHS